MRVTQNREDKGADAEKGRTADRTVQFCDVLDESTEWRHVSTEMVQQPSVDNGVESTG